MPIALIPFALLGYILVRRAIVAAEDALSRVVALPDAQQAERRAEALKVDLEAPEWPYTSVALRRLVASALLPIIVWAVDLVVRVKF
jgi:hypothetical protein